MIEKLPLWYRLTWPVRKHFLRGVYRRQFKNGYVLWNPRGADTRMVQFPRTFRKLTDTDYVFVPPTGIRGWLYRRRMRRYRKRAQICWMDDDSPPTYIDANGVEWLKNNRSIFITDDRS